MHILKNVIAIVALVAVTLLTACSTGPIGPTGPNRHYPMEGSAYFALPGNAYYHLEGNGFFKSLTAQGIDGRKYALVKPEVDAGYVKGMPFGTPEEWIVVGGNRNQKFSRTTMTAQDQSLCPIFVANPTAFQ